MSETENNPPVKTLPSGGHGILWFILVVVFAIAAGVFAAVYWPPVRDRIVTAADVSQTPSGRMQELERKTQALETRVDALQTRMDNIAATAPAVPSASAVSPANSSVADLAHMQSDLTELATTVGSLQSQIKQNGAAVQTMTQAATAKMIAYMQLRDATAAGHGFSKELDALRTATKADPAFKQPLDTLTPYADKGAPDLTSLRTQLDEQTNAAEAATEKAAAQTWWERILAEFRGLVLIRSLHDGDARNNALVTMKSALAQGDLAAALDIIKTLPPEAQKTLEGWRQQAEARLAIDDALQAIAGRLAAGNDTAPPSPAQDKGTP